MSEVQEVVTRKGFSLEQLNECIDTYVDINVWTVNPSRTKLTLVSAVDAPPKKNKK
jgi:hypothetical protein